MKVFRVTMYLDHFRMTCSLLLGVFCSFMFLESDWKYFNSLPNASAMEGSIEPQFILIRMFSKAFV